MASHSTGAVRSRISTAIPLTQHGAAGAAGLDLEGQRAVRHGGSRRRQGGGNRKVTGGTRREAIQQREQGVLVSRQTGEQGGPVSRAKRVQASPGPVAAVFLGWHPQRPP